MGRFTWSSPASGKESGCECIKKQIELNRQIRSPLPEEVIEEYSKLYRVVIKAKKKPEPPPEAPKPEPKKMLPLSKFQQQMNDIYKESEKEKKPNAPNPANKLKLHNGDLSPPKNSTPSPTAAKETEKKIEDKKINGFHVDIEAKENENDGPSLADIRAMWKKKRPEPEKKKQDEFNINEVFEDLMKKAEEKSNNDKASPAVDEHLAESMNEEILWAMQQKKQHEEDNRSVEEKRQILREKEEKEKKEKMEKEEELQRKIASDKIKSEQAKEQEMIQNIA